MGRRIALKSSHHDTIVAQATASGRGGIGIVRLSGDKAKCIAEKITQKKCFDKIAALTFFYKDNNNEIDQGII